MYFSNIYYLNFINIHIVNNFYLNSLRSFNNFMQKTLILLRAFNVHIINKYYPLNNAFKV